MTTFNSSPQGEKIYRSMDSFVMEERFRQFELELKNQAMAINTNISSLQITMQETSLKYDRGLKEAVDAMRDFSNDVKNLSTTMVNAATGKDHIPAPMVKLIVRTLGIVIIFLAFSLVFVSTGVKMGFLPNFHSEFVGQIKHNTEEIKILQKELNLDEGKK